jgi:hypothetical protein
MRVRAAMWEGADDMADVGLAPPIAGSGGGIAASYELWRAHEAGGDA